jgi:mono/diheme cytochrome c family protein
VLDPNANLGAPSQAVAKVSTIPITNMSAAVRTAFERGRDIFQKESYCGTCHGEDGKGAIVGIYPPLVESEWIEDEELLVKIILKGLWGKIEVKGVEYDPAKGIPPMTPFEGMMSDQEVANVTTYTRVAFRGNKVIAELTTEETVTKIRAAIADKQGFYTPEELLKDHPIHTKKK